MMAAMLWTLIALLGTVLIGLVVDVRAGRRELRTEIKSDMGALRSEVHLLAERQAEMNGRLDLVAAIAHTHPPAVPGRQG